MQPDEHQIPDGYGYPAGGTRRAELVPLVADQHVRMMRPPQQPIVPNATVNWLAVLAAFRRRWLVAVSLGLLLGGTAGAAAWKSIPSPFTAFAELQMREVRERVLFTTAETESGFHTYKQTQMRLAKSPFVLAAALRKPEVANLSMIKATARPVEMLEKKIEVGSPATEFIRISLSGDNPEELAVLVNAVNDAYLTEIVYADETRRRERRTNLEKINSDIEGKLRKKREAMRKLAEVLHTGDSQALTVKQQMAVEYFAQLRKEYTQVRFDLLRLTTQLASRQANTPADDISIPDEVLDSEVEKQSEMLQIRQRMAQLEALVLQTAERVADPQHKLLVGYRQDLAKQQSNLELALVRLRPSVLQRIQKNLIAQAQGSVAKLQNQISVLESQRDQLDKELQTQKQEAYQIGIASFDLESLKKEIEQTDLVAKRVSEEIARLEIELQSPPRVVSHRVAEVPHAPDMKRRQQTTGFAAFGVFGLIVGGMTFLELRARRINSMEQVIDGLALRVVGTLPVMRSWLNRGKKSDNARRSAMRSIWTESVDAARTLLLRESSRDDTTKVMIVSAVAGEGKTTLATHLAPSLARAGRKTLLIDTDMRRPSVHKVFDVPLTPGFCEVLQGKLTLSDVILPLATEGLFVIPAGKMTHETLRALAKNVTGTIFDQLFGEFDFIIIDSAPVLPVTDSLIIAQHADKVLFAIRRDVSQYAKVSAACQKLSMLGIPIVGAVVIGLDESTYGYSPYKYGYGTYGYHA